MGRNLRLGGGVGEGGTSATVGRERVNEGERIIEEEEEDPLEGAGGGGSEETEGGVRRSEEEEVGMEEVERVRRWTRGERGSRRGAELSLEGLDSGVVGGRGVGQRCEQTETVRERGLDVRFVDLEEAVESGRFGNGPRAASCFATVVGSRGREGTVEVSVSSARGWKVDLRKSGREGGIDARSEEVEMRERVGERGL